MGVLIIPYNIRGIALSKCLYLTNTDRYMSELKYLKFLSDLGSYYIPYKVILNWMKKMHFYAKCLLVSRWSVRQKYIHQKLSKGKIRHFNLSSLNKNKCQVWILTKKLNHHRTTFQRMGLNCPPSRRWLMHHDW